MTEASIQIEDLQIAGKVAKLVKIVGQLDESNVDEKIQEIYKVVEANPSGLNLIFDLEGLQYMNSKSIGYLTDLYGKITETGGKVVITQAKPNILDILQVVGLTQLIKTVTTKDEAMAEINGQVAAVAPATAVAPTPVVTEAQVTPAAPVAPAPAPMPTATITEAPLSAPVAAPAVPTAPAAELPATPAQVAAPITPAAPAPMPTATITESPLSAPAVAVPVATPAPATPAAPVAELPVTPTPAVAPTPDANAQPAATPTYNLGQQ